MNKSFRGRALYHRGCERLDTAFKSGKTGAMALRAKGRVRLGRVKGICLWKWQPWRNYTSKIRGIGKPFIFCFCS